VPLESKTGRLVCRLHELEASNVALRSQVRDLSRKLTVERALRKIREGNRKKALRNSESV